MTGISVLADIVGLVIIFSLILFKLYVTFTITQTYDIIWESAVTSHDLGGFHSDGSTLNQYIGTVRIVLSFVLSNIFLAT